MRNRSLPVALLSALFALSLALFGCAVTGGGGTTGGGGSGGTPTVGPTSTPTPPNHALAWYQYDGQHVPQIWASVNGAAATQITHVAKDPSECTTQVAWSPPVFSPDLSHIVAALGSYNCGDGALTGQLSVITVAGGAVAAVPGPVHPYDANIRLTVRQAGWVSNTIVWWVNYQSIYEYTLGGSSIEVANTGHFVEDAVLRGDVLTYATGIGSYELRRYNISTHSALGGSVNLGSSHACQCSPGDRIEPGFDVSHDGAHLVFQRTAPNGNGDGDGVASSQFFYANADGSAESQIAHYVSTDHFALLQFSPNGSLVSIGAASPTPTVITASVTSPGNKGDPDLHFYAPDGFSYAVWKWDESAFWVATKYNGENYPTAGDLEHQDLGAAAGSVAAAGGYNPWYTIGS